MILNRLGNKRALAKKLIPLFPQHDVYIEPFFGAGGMFFSKPQSPYNILNDFDEEVFNLFMVVKDRLEEFESLLEIMPIHQALLKYWSKNKETDPVKRAVRFIFLSNFGYLGMPRCLWLGINNTKQLILDNLKQTHNILKNVIFDNSDFERFIKNVIDRNKDFTTRYFCYNDPPYLDTASTYDTPKWSLNDFERLVKANMDKGWKFGISEFNHPEIVRVAKENSLFITEVGERVNLKNRRVEIYISNYKPIKELFDYKILGGDGEH